MVVQQSQLVEFLINDVHDVLRGSPVFESLSELLLDGFFVLFFQTKLLRTATCFGVLVTANMFILNSVEHNMGDVLNQLNMGLIDRSLLLYLLNDLELLLQ